MEVRNELGFLVPSRYYSSDFEVPSKETEVRPHTTTLRPSEVSTISDDTMGSSQSSNKQSEGHRSNGPNLLDIPLEIRLHIYHYVLLSHPIHHAHLAPLAPQPDFSGLNTAEFHTIMMRSNGTSSLPKEIITRTLITHSSCLATSDSPASESYISTHLSSSPYSTRRIQGKIPTALLTSCSQIFAEVSLLPWHRNTFSFINWFWSGVYAAKQFSSNLPAWQRDAMRNVAVEVLGKDLWVGGLERRASGGVNGRSSGSGTGSGSGIGKVEGSTSSTGGVGGKEGKGVGQWRELCGLWSGIRNLKLTIKGGLVIDTRSSGSSEHISGRLSVLNTNCEWVSHGLMALTSLRTLELEIEDTDVPSESKMAFCAALERCLVTKDRKAMGADDWVGDTRVIFMEKTRVVQDTKKDKFVYYGGDPGDDSVWSEEM